MNVVIGMVGFDRIVIKLRSFDRTFAGVIRTMLTRAGLAAQRETMKRTPVLTGTLRRSMTSEVDASPFPMAVHVGTNLVYGPFIEFGIRRGRGGRGTVLRRAGPARMLRDGLSAALAAITSAVERAAREVEALWRT